MDGALVDRMLDAVRDIPPGHVLTYADVAASAGSASPRLAGWVLSNFADESVPWHRVVRADGTCAAHLADEQLSRLRDEGVEIRDGRVDMRAAGRGRPAVASQRLVKRARR